MLLGILFSKQFRVDDKNGSWLGFREQGGEEEDWSALPAKKPNAQRQRLHSWALLSLFVTSSYDVCLDCCTGNLNIINLTTFLLSLHKMLLALQYLSIDLYELSKFSSFLQVLSDYSLFVKGEGDSFMALLVYVDDVVIASPDLEQVQYKPVKIPKEIGKKLEEWATATQQLSQAAHRILRNKAPDHHLLHLSILVRDFAREREKIAPTMGAAAANGADAATLLSSSSDLLRRRRWWTAAVSNDAMDVSAVGNGDGLSLSPELASTGAPNAKHSAPFPVCFVIFFIWPRVREREIVGNSDDASSSGGGIGDLQDNGVGGGEAKDFDASSATFDASKNQPWRVFCSPELTISQRVFDGVQEVGGGRHGSPERETEAHGGEKDLDCYIVSGTSSSIEGERRLRRWRSMVESEDGMELDPVVEMWQHDGALQWWQQ
nr:Retrovirus-related Pol polyprotein from transposon RE1 [Ipomoea batatas]